MKRIILCLCLFIFIRTEAQQINPVPDYVFSNKMSVGRNAVTDTAAYFSIGPRYGAIRGMMPPMVTDTASMSATKRNGLLIFSIQKNKYLYWDSVGSKWAEMAGTGGTAISSGDTASMLTPYTRGSGTTNFLPKFTGTRTFGNSVAFDNGGTELLVNTTADSGAYALQINGAIYGAGDINLKTNSMIRNAGRDWLHMGTSGITRIYDGTPTGGIQFYNGNVYTALLSSSGEFLLGAPNTDAGAYRLQVSGDIYNTGGAVFAATSGNVGIKIANATVSLDVLANSASNNTVAARFRGNVSTNNNTQIRFYGANAAADQWAIGNAVATGDATRNFDIFDLVASNNRLRIKDDGEVLIGTTTDAGAYALQVAGAIYNTTTITTGAPTGGSIKPWRLGEAATVSPTSPNRTIRVEIDGTVYYLHAKTTND